MNNTLDASTRKNEGVKDPFGSILKHPEINNHKCPSLEEHDSHCGCGESSDSQVDFEQGSSVQKESNSPDNIHSQDNTSVGITENVVRYPQTEGLVVIGTGTIPDTFASLIAELENQELVYHRNSERIAKIEAYKKAQKIVENAIENCTKSLGDIDPEDLKRELGI